MDGNVPFIMYYPLSFLVVPRHPRTTTLFEALAEVLYP